MKKERTQLEYKDYFGTYHYDRKAKIYHGEIVDISDVITFQGANREELEKAFCNSVDDYLDFYVKLRKKPRLTKRLREEWFWPEDPSKKRDTNAADNLLHIPDEIAKRLKQVSKYLNMPPEIYMATALEQYIEDIELLMKAQKRSEEEPKNIPYKKAVKQIKKLRS